MSGTVVTPQIPINQQKLRKRKIQIDRIPYNRFLKEQFVTKASIVTPPLREPNKEQCIQRNTKKYFQIVREQLFYGLHLNNLKGDVYGAITAAVVALPLALAFGVSSGMGPLAGLYGSIFVGFFAAILGGTPAQVTGPTGPMSVVTAAIVLQFNQQPEVIFSIVFLSGLLQLIIAATRLGELAQLVPAVVTSGFMSGVGVIMIATQAIAMTGHAPVGNVVAAVQAFPAAAMGANLACVALGAASLLISSYMPKRIENVVPGSLVALVTLTTISSCLGLGVPILGAVPAALPTLIPLSFPPALMPAMVKAALTLALLGTIDSLLTSLVADNLTDTYHRPGKELVGQGIGNAVAGLFGGTPSAGATVRTVVNIRAGGRTPLSGALHSVILLSIVLGMGQYVSLVPIPVLAGILIKSGLGIIDWQLIKKSNRIPITSSGVMAITLLITVCYDLIYAVVIGSLLSAWALSSNLAERQVASTRVIAKADTQDPEQLALVPPQMSANGVFVQISGTLVFSGCTGMMRKVKPYLNTCDMMIIDVGQVTWLDDTAGDMLAQLAITASKKRVPFYICNASQSVAVDLRKWFVTDNLRNGNPCATADECFIHLSDTESDTEWINK